MAGTHGTHHGYDWMVLTRSPRRNTLARHYWFASRDEALKFVRRCFNDLEPHGKPVAIIREQS
jgi:hypothetical protein